MELVGVHSDVNILACIHIIDCCINVVFGTVAWLMLKRKDFLLKQSWFKMMLGPWEESRRATRKECLVWSPGEPWR